MNYVTSAIRLTSIQIFKFILSFIYIFLLYTYILVYSYIYIYIFVVVTVSLIFKLYLHYCTYNTPCQLVRIINIHRLYKHIPTYVLIYIMLDYTSVALTSYSKMIVQSSKAVRNNYLKFFTYIMRSA